MGLQFWPAAVELRGFNREEKIRELVGEGERSVGVFDKRFGFKCEGGKVLVVSMIGLRTYS